MKSASTPKEYLPLVKRGEEKALAQWVHNELPHIYALALRLCSRQKDVEDLCEKVFSKAVVEIKQLQKDASLSTWLERLTVNTWKNCVQRGSRPFFKSRFPLSISSTSLADSHPLETLDNEPTTDEITSLKEDEQPLGKALNHLEPGDKAIVVLRDVMGKTIDDIAAIVNANPGTVKLLLSRARGHLRAMVKKWGER